MENQKLTKLKKDAKRLQTIYRCSLRYIGKGSNYHIYNLSESYLDEFPFCPEVNFLMLLKTYYMGLTLFNRKILISEVLERSQYSPFWFLPEVSNNEYYTCTRAIIVDVEKTAKKAGLLA